MIEFEREDVVFSLVAMDPETQLPVYMHKRPSTCKYNDVVGILQGYKPCSIIPYWFFSKNLQLPKHIKCGDKLVPMKPADYRKAVIDECKKQKVLVFDVDKNARIAFKRENARMAAALWVLYYQDYDGNEGDFGGYAIGRLLGYDKKDIRAWYHGQVLQHVTMTSDSSNEWWLKPKSAADAELARAVTKGFFEHYKRWEAKAERKLRAFLRSSRVDEAVKTITAKMKPLV